jgi:hypothetical protein
LIFKLKEFAADKEKLEIVQSERVASPTSTRLQEEDNDQAARVHQPILSKI